ncbi:endonuclease/exonuclease/phosphatase family protein [Chelativorans salis]|uniref:Endonuclease/exonuclease/phosphatase family protein n=1 Tax=Chelativorans salis TaxID=2978478 RepID=A0ABT2LP09_9HYPH|nr:endonuclease/exonuclease/phosphatase family protein [Chelativorans sp. EGI FJ00035]MCT7376297.1 endonuclease/exonuclease/phosphatase family protein [Chelativorans sp. EGI FJ00035]
MVLRTGIEILAPDLIALQETIVRPDCDQLRDFLRPVYGILHSDARDPDGGGISVASRWPILRFHELDLDVTPDAVGIEQGFRRGCHIGGFWIVMMLEPTEGDEP